MRIFITGASGWIGKELVPELLHHGHSVLALARSPLSAQSLRDQGAEVVQGSISDTDVLKSSAAASDAVIHLAFVANFENMAEDCATERAALQAMADGMKGTNNPLIMTTGTFSVADFSGKRGGRVADEETDSVRDVPPFSVRTATEDFVLELSDTMGVQGMIVRPAPTVHGKGDDKFMFWFAELAKKNGRAVYVGDAKVRWPAVHVKDAAVAFRLAVEKGKARGVYHVVNEGAVEMKLIMEKIAEKVGVPVESVSLAEATQAMGKLGNLIALDDPVSSEKTRRELGWKPKELGLLDDLEQNYVFIIICCQDE
jgi:nucleoside-diphosphate-sugar epimerase